MIGTFEQYMVRVDRRIDKMIGLVSADLPDLDWYSMYDDNLSVVEAVKIAMEEWNCELGLD